MDFVVSPSNLENAVKSFGIPFNPKLFIPKNSVHVGDHLPIIRLEQAHRQRDLFDPNGYRLNTTHALGLCRTNSRVHANRTGTNCTPSVLNASSTNGPSRGSSRKPAA